MTVDPSARANPDRIRKLGGPSNYRTWKRAAASVVSSMNGCR